VNDLQIDPIEFGRLQAEVTSLRRDFDALLKAIETNTVMLHEMRDTLAEAKGGWRLMLAVGGAVGSVAAGVAWATQHIKWMP